LPSRCVGEVLVVALSLAVGSLTLYAEMTSARLGAVQGVDTHELGNFQEVGNTIGFLKDLVQLFTAADYAKVVPELIP
jgi:hypothetical protein